MFKRMFQFSSNDNEAPLSARNGSAARQAGIAKLSSALERETETPGNGAPLPNSVPPPFETFEEVYVAGGVKPGKAYSILKVAEMLNSRHLTEMSLDAKRSALMMALEAASAEIGELLQDAVARNRTLDEYEEKRQEQVKNFEVTKQAENDKLHAELARMTSQFMEKIQANSDQVAREQDDLRAWQKRKQQESQRITDAATFCVPQGNGANGPNSLAAVLERVSVGRR